MDHIREILKSYIPKNIDECMEWLDVFVVDRETIKKIPEDKFVAMCHHGLGRQLRNDWKLWGDGDLSAYFQKLEIHHADDMSGIILTSWHRKLNGKLVDLEGQIKHYQEYWRSQVNQQISSS